MGDEITTKSQRSACSVAGCIGCNKPPSEGHELHENCVSCLMNSALEISLENPDEIKQELENIFRYFSIDVVSAFNKDPAAKSIVEVLTSYPGIQAVLLYRVAHFLHLMGLPFVPRYLSYVARQMTGVDIHPGAVIGSDFFIDHGQGVVIGETAEIGNNVTLYQGVTLGGVSLEQKKRHPTLMNNIVVGAGAKILGPVTIGNNVRIGANSVVTKSIPDNSVVVGVPGRVISDSPEQHDEISQFAHNRLPDPVVKLIERLENRIASLEGKIDPKREDYGDFII